MCNLDLTALGNVIDMANTHVEDIESGIEEGIYDASENTDLDQKKADVASLQALHKHLRDHEASMTRGIYTTINGQTLSVGVVYGHCHQVVREYDGTEHEGQYYPAGSTTFENLSAGTKYPWFTDIRKAIEYLEQQPFSGHIQSYVMAQDGSGPSWITAGMHYCKREGNRHPFLI